MTSSHVMVLQLKLITFLHAWYLIPNININCYRVITIWPSFPWGKHTTSFINLAVFFSLAKNGPIYDAVWSPNSTEFCVVYGFMPAKATIFNLKCDPVFDFGTGPHNAAYYSPQGHILVLAGFGNLSGQLDVWDVKKYKLISKPQASNSTYFAWCPNGEHIVTATCSPRLRVGNGYKVWHYTGSVLYKYEVPPTAELWQVAWQPFLDGAFAAKAVTYNAVPSKVPNDEAKAAQAYRPPALRNKPVASLKLVSNMVLCCRKCSFEMSSLSWGRVTTWSCLMWSQIIGPSEPSIVLFGFQNCAMVFHYSTMLGICVLDLLRVKHSLDHGVVA